MEFVSTINIPGISENMLSIVRRLDYLLSRVSFIDEVDIRVAAAEGGTRWRTMYLQWINEIQDLHQDLIRLNIATLCNNHPMWTTIDAMAKQEVPRLIDLIRKYW